MTAGLPEDPSYPGHSPSFFRYAAPWTTAEGQHTASSNSVACFHFFFSPAPLLPFFVSSFFSFSWWAVTFIPTLAPSFPALRNLAGQVSAMLHLLQMGPSAVLTTFPLQIQSSWSCPPALTLWLPLRTPPTCIPLLYNLAPPPLLILHSRTTLVSKLLIPHPPFLYLLSLPSHLRLLLLAALLRLLPPLLPLTLSGLFNGMLEVFEPGALNYFTFFRPTLSTLSAFWNPILTHLPDFWILCSAFWSYPLPVWHSLSWCHAR